MSLNDEGDLKDMKEVLRNYGDTEDLERGLLTTQVEIDLRLHSNPIKLWEESESCTSYLVKCQCKDMRQCHNDEEQEEDLPSKVTVSVLNGRYDEPALQGSYGTIYNNNDYMIFHSQTSQPQYMSYQLDVYKTLPECETADRSAELLGSCYILADSFDELTGLLTLPLHQKSGLAGKLTVDYLVVKPLKMEPCLESCNEDYWKNLTGTLDIGHRGMGSSFKSQDQKQHPDFTMENTIESFAVVGDRGGDMVEFDVQLTKDRIPIVYHDYTVVLKTQKKNSSDSTLFKVPIHELTYGQLKELQVDHMSSIQSGVQSFISVDEQDEEKGVFPQLKLVCEKVPPNVGFNIEIKYCMTLKNGCREDGLKYYHERNEYVDTILTEVIKYAESRKVIFSSFDPDICTMLRLKQNRFPVLFIPLGGSTAWMPYNDVRCGQNHMAMYFAKSQRFLGVVAHTEDLLQDPSLVTQATDLGLIVFCWGDDNNKKENVEILRNLGVNGIIYDRL